MSALNPPTNFDHRLPNLFISRPVLLNGPALVSAATAFAIEAHNGQKYGDDDYFTAHVSKVVDIVREQLNATRSYTLNASEIITAALLHDVVEDTDVTLSTVVAQFGHVVAGYVWALTDEPGANRAERHLNTYWKIRQGEETVLIKVADRIANVEAGIATKNAKKGKMYRKEHPTFKAALYDPRHAYVPWDRLAASTEYLTEMAAG